MKTDSEKIAAFEKNLETEYKGLIEQRNEEIERLQSEIELKSKCTNELKMTVNILQEECNELKAEKERIENDTVRLGKQYEKGANYYFFMLKGLMLCFLNVER